MLSKKCDDLLKIARNDTNDGRHTTFSNASSGMEPKKTMVEKGGDPVTWAEAVEDDLKAKDLARKLLRKLDTRCVTP
jgi:hypothetical protein